MSFVKTIIPLSLVGYDVIITSYSTRVRGKQHVKNLLNEFVLFFYRWISTLEA